MPVQNFTAVAGVAKQASKGTLATAAAYAHGLTGGSPIQVEVSQSPVEVTAGRRAQYNVFRDAVNNGSSIETLGYMRSLGLYLLGAIGTDTVTGIGPYVHTYSTGDLPYLSVFTRGIDSTNEGIRDCKVDELTLKWEGSRPVDLSVKLNGTVFSYPASIAPTSVNISSIAFAITTATYTTATNHGLTAGQSVTVTGATAAGNNGVFTVATAPTTTTFTVSNAAGSAQAGAAGTITAWADETASESFLVPVGGTFQLDVSGSTLASARIVGGELSIKNNLSGIEPSAQVERDDNYEGVQEHSLKLTIVPDNLNDFRKAVTGGAAGTTVSLTAPLGSVSLLFKDNSITANQLLVTGSKVAFMVAFPDADAKGGPVQIELAGMAVMPTAGVVPLTYALTNGVATY